MTATIRLDGVDKCYGHRDVLTGVSLEFPDSKYLPRCRELGCS
jgi:hypothetical protein